MLQKMAACGNSRTDSHMCQRLHKLIESSTRSLPVPISTADIRIRASRRGRPLKTRVVKYPMLLPSAWATSIFKMGGHFLLAGLSLNDVDSFGDTLEVFWERFKVLEPDYEVPGNPRYTLPYALHGDEGRGKGKKPIMILGMQPLITSHDMSTSNLGGILVRKASNVSFVLCKAWSTFYYKFHKPELFYLHLSQAYAVHTAPPGRDSVCLLRQRRDTGWCVAGHSR